VLNKIDLLPYLDYSVDELLANLKKVNPKIRIFQVSAKTGEGMEALFGHISENIDKKKS
jgi:hydrogenase nickel incorporation protein HypB